MRCPGYPVILMTYRYKRPYASLSCYTHGVAAKRRGVTWATYEVAAKRRGVTGAGGPSTEHRLYLTKLDSPSR